MCSNAGSRPTAGSAFDFQREVWSAYLKGESGLIHSATGSGKTLAAWLGPLAEWMAEREWDPGLPRDDVTPAKAGARSPALRVLWITPMRALASRHRIYSLERAVEGLKAAVDRGPAHRRHVERRAREAGAAPALGAGHDAREPRADALQSRGAREALRPAPRGRGRVARAPGQQARRDDGARASPACARWNPKLRTWGLSATLGNLEEALERLIGVRPWSALEGEKQPSGLSPNPVVKGVSDKQIVIDTLIPARHRQVSVGGAHRPRDARAAWSRRSTARVPRSCSPTCAPRRRSGTRACSRRGPSGRA